MLRSDVGESQLTTHPREDEPDAPGSRAPRPCRPRERRGTGRGPERRGRAPVDWRWQGAARRGTPRTAESRRQPTPQPSLAGGIIGDGPEPRNAARAAAAATCDTPRLVTMAAEASG